MSEEAETMQKISKMQKENKRLQQLLESAELEMKTIVEKSQEESQHLQKALQSVLPKLQNKLQSGSSTSSLSTASVNQVSRSIQTENSLEWSGHLESLQASLKSLEKIASDLIKSQNTLQGELQTAQKREELILHEVSNNQQEIMDLEVEIAEYKKQLALMQEEFQVLCQHILYESLIGNPTPAIFSILG